MSNVRKSIEITDAKIKFVSLVDKAANKKSFLLTKQDGDGQGFQTIGRIIKVDSDSHYVTGVVYEPMVKDAHDNFMREDEIEKAAHWFMKNGNAVDIQHSFEKADGLTVVESSVTKADQEIEGEQIKKGTWLMTVEVNNDEVWKAVENGELTGLSMGGVGKYASDDVNIDKAAEAPKEAPDKLNLLERLAKALGFENAIVKGEMRERYEKRVRAERFWIAFNTLEGLLRRWDSWHADEAYETDESKIRSALEDFNEIIMEILRDESAEITKELHDGHPTEASADDVEPVEKAGRKMSRANKDKLKCIAQQLIDFTKEFDDDDEAAKDEQDGKKTEDEEEEKEETEVTNEQIQKMVDEAVAKAMKPAEQPVEQVEKQEEKPAPELTAEAVQKMIDAAIEKAIKPAEKEADPAPEADAVNTDSVQKMIDENIAKAFKQRGLAASIDDGSNGAVEKATEQHYLHGLL